MDTEHLGETLTIVLGISSGILTLVGLIAVFVSINSQHNIQKCRELLWDIRSTSIFEDLNDTKILKERLEKFWLYGDLLKGGDKITHVTVRLSKITIFIVISIWLSTLFYIKNEIVNMEFIYILVVTIIGIGIMSSFYYLLSLLKKFNKLSGLPTFEELLDSHNTYINTLAIAAHTYSFIVKEPNRNQERHSFLLSFSNDYKNINLSLSDIRYIDEQGQEISGNEIIETPITSYIDLSFANRERKKSYNISPLIDTLLPSKEKIKGLDSIEFSLFMTRVGRPTSGVDIVYNMRVPLKKGTLKPIFRNDMQSAEFITNNEIVEQNNSKQSVLKFFKNKKNKKIRVKLPYLLRNTAEFDFDSILKMTKDEVKSLNYMTPLLYKELQTFLESEGLNFKTRENVLLVSFQNMTYAVYKRIFKKHSTKIEDLNFSTRTYNCLKRSGINNLSQITKLKKSELLNIRHLGLNSANEVIEKLDTLGVRLKE